MLCISCQAHFPDGSINCPECGHPVPVEWELIKTVFPPENEIIKGLLEVCGIPVMLRGESIGPIEGLTFGPLAEVRIYVPLEKTEEARDVLASDYEISDEYDPGDETPDI